MAPGHAHVPSVVLQEQAMPVDRAGHVFVVTFGDAQDLRQVFGAAHPADGQLELVRDAARIVVAGVGRMAADLGEHDRAVVLLGQTIVAPGPLESRDLGVQVVTTTEGLSLDDDGTVLLGQTTWAPAVRDWLVGDTSRGDAIARVAQDLLTFVRHYTKAA